MKFEYILLGLFAMRPWSGYDLGKWLAGGGKFFRSNSDQSHIYRLLGRMEQHGWIDHVVEPRDGRPDAKVYRMTEAGRQELLAWARSPYTPPSRFQDADFLVRFTFGGIVDPTGLRELLVTELDARREQVRVHRDRDRAQEFIDPIPEVDVERARILLEAGHLRGMQEIDAWIDWLERTLDTFDRAGVTAAQALASAELR